ncbi:M20 family metallopeptidase [Sporosarcina pasteurii]|uniref:Uncharacterized hydrolase YxeP n=1 Tax=Sporosarcina pasteurii TaxID=1474 RepID=A0A380BC16_SPOPA|nr:amidohydrolase [Sporosarcina pasteurii]MDS9472421.1 amidohydrolase [Sporosarcina pasteurii]SUI98858.1 Uncharacterized hydrolase YxeP [Sporosarcina pasteurii]
MLNKALTKISNYYEEMVADRRFLHMHPELSHQEVHTPAFIADRLESLGIEVQRNVGGRGVVGMIRGGQPGKTVAFRADFDALPITDQKDVSYKSTIPGVMHACGHDGHTAALLGFAKAMNEIKESLPGNIVLIHQFGEELSPGGARGMIEDGCLDGVDLVFGAHLQSQMPANKVYVRDGFLQASEDSFKITVTGFGTHGAEPHTGVDPILAASHIMIALQSIASRNADPLKELVVSVGSFHAGHADNVIPNEAVMEGTIRVFDPELRIIAGRRVIEIAKSVGAGLGCDVHVDIIKGYDSVNNDPDAMNLVRRGVAEAFSEENIIETNPIMPVEDFSYYLQHRPGAYFFVGAQMDNKENVFPHHHEKFDFYEPAMEMTAKVFASTFFEAQK